MWVAESILNKSQLMNISMYVSELNSYKSSNFNNRQLDHLILLYIYCIHTYVCNKPTTCNVRRSTIENIQLNFKYKINSFRK